MMNNLQFTNNAKKSAQQVAKKIAQENLEFLKSARNQVAPLETAPMSQASAQTGQQLGGETNIDPNLKAKIDADSKRILTNLEEELRQLRLKRAQQIEAYNQPDSAKAPPGAAKPAEVILPQGKRRNVFGGMKAKLQQVAGKREMQKNASG